MCFVVNGASTYALRERRVPFVSPTRTLRGPGKHIVARAFMAIAIWLGKINGGVKV